MISKFYLAQKKRKNKLKFNRIQVKQWKNCSIVIVENFIAKITQIKISNKLTVNFFHLLYIPNFFYSFFQLSFISFPFFFFLNLSLILNRWRKFLPKQITVQHNCIFWQIIIVQFSQSLNYPYMEVINCQIWSIIPP